MRSHRTTAGRMGETKCLSEATAPILYGGSSSSGDMTPSPLFSSRNGGPLVDEPTMQLLLTDALLLDAFEGLASIADRLVELYDRWNANPDHRDDVALLAQVLTDLGWWSGRFQGAVSAETAFALVRMSSGAS